MKTAAEIAQSIGTGAVSAAEIVAEHLSLIDALEPQLEAWVHVDRAGATQGAQTIDAARPSEGSLLGVPVGIKDIFDVASLTTTMGAAAFAQRQPAEDAEAVRRLRDAGAIILGKTATTAFAHQDPAPTRNPWNREHTPGGSSSGSAAAVATGMATVALGSQTVGSVLRPAAYCGVVGLKPSYGRISVRGVYPLTPSFDHVGIFSRSVLDAALVLNAIAGYDPHDLLSADEPVEDYAAAVRRGGAEPVIGLARRFYKDRAGDKVCDHLDAVADRLAAAGAKVVEVEMPLAAQEIRDLGQPVFMSETAAVHRQAYAEHEAEYRPLIRGHIAAGLEVRAVDYVKAKTDLARLRRDLIARLGEVNVLLLPAAPATAPKGLESTGDAVFCAPASFTGLPAIALPSDLSDAGLPLAVQLIGRPFEEAALLGAAAWVERVLDFKAAPPVHDA